MNNGLKIAHGNIGAGMVAGFIATLVLAILLVMEDKIGLAPNLHLISPYGTLLGADRAAAWLAFFLVGTGFWGVAYSLFADRLPGGTIWAVGASFGVVVWLVLMIIILPLSGGGFFGNAAAIGGAGIAVSLILNVIFGAVLAECYSKL